MLGTRTQLTGDTPAAHLLLRHLLLMTVPLALAASLSAADWPHWLGPNHNGLTDDGPLRTTFEGQLKPVWQHDIGPKKDRRRDGGSPVVVDGVVYAFHLESAYRTEERWKLSLNAKPYKKSSRKFSKASKEYIEKKGKKTTLTWENRAAFDAWMAKGGLGDKERKQLAELATNKQQYRINHLDAYALDDGSSTWHVEWPGELNKGWFGGAVHATPAVVDGVIYLVESDGSIHARSTADGSSVWQSKVTVWGRYAGANSSPLIYDGRVYLSTMDMQLALSAKDGSVVWKKEMRTEDNSNAIFTDASGKAVLIAPALNSKKNPLFGLDPATGEEVWSVPMAGSRYMTGVVSGSHLITVQSDASNKKSPGVYAYDLSTTPPKKLFDWPGAAKTDEFMGSQICSCAIARDGRVYWGTEKGLYCLSLEDGSLVWSNLKQKTSNYSTLILTGDVLVAMVKDKGWGLFRTDTGEAIHLQDVDQGKWHPVTSPALSDGRLVLRATNLGLACYDLRPPGQ